MTKIKPTRDLLKVRDFLEKDGIDLVLIDSPIHGGVFICLKNEVLLEKLCRLKGGSLISEMTDGASVRLWAERMPCQPQIFLQKRLATALKSIKRILPDLVFSEKEVADDENHDDKTILNRHDPGMA